jgi:hypothetical protein
MLLKNIISKLLYLANGIIKDQYPTTFEEFGLPN